MIRLLILDVSGLYSQIYDELWCFEYEVEKVKAEYSNFRRFRVVVTS